MIWPIVIPGLRPSLLLVADTNFLLFALYCTIDVFPLGTSSPLLVAGRLTWDRERLSAKGIASELKFKSLFFDCHNFFLSIEWEERALHFCWIMYISSEGLGGFESGYFCGWRILGSSRIADWSVQFCDA